MPRARRDLNPTKSSSPSKKAQYISAMYYTKQNSSINYGSIKKSIKSILSNSRLNYKAKRSLDMQIIDNKKVSIQISLCEQQRLICIDTFCRYIKPPIDRACHNYIR